jgi:hypothetical protein
MDPTESIVADFLKARGYKDIVFEPDGNVPPDFLVERKIAVEARRLNQTHIASSGAQGLEEVAVPLWQKIRKLALSLGPPTRGQTWFVFVRFDRPVDRWKTLGPKVCTALQNFMATATHKKATIAVSTNFELGLFRASKPHPTFYVMGGHSDGQSGGFLVAEMERNLRLHIAEKTGKIAKFRSRYPEWWLVLVDHIAYGLDDTDIAQFKQGVSIPHTWHKVIVVDPHHPGRFFEF